MLEEQGVSSEGEIRQLKQISKEARPLKVSHKTRDYLVRLHLLDYLDSLLLKMRHKHNQVS